VQQVGIVGTPDFLGCVGGAFVAIELKRAAKAHLRPMQKYNLKRIEAAGGFGLVAFPENWQACLEFLQMLAAAKGRANAEGDLWAASRSKLCTWSDEAG
jgi:hypothetical protein